jgi:hypothetical protein
MEKIFRESAPANDGREITMLAELQEKYEVLPSLEHPEKFEPGPALTAAKQKSQKQSRP